MAGAELRQPQRQFAVGAEALAEDQDVARAVHRLQREDLVLVLHVGDEHVLAELFPVAGAFPQRAVHQLRGLDLLVACRVQTAAHVGLGREVKLPALGVPEHAADRLFLEVEQVHLLADAAVVAAFRLLQHMEVGVEFLLVAPRGAVDARQHGVAVIAAPIRAGDLHQLERRTDIGGGAHVRAAAQIDPVALAVERDGLVARQVLDDLGLVLLALVLEEPDRVVAVDHLAGEFFAARHDLAHLRLDRTEILRRERLVAGEVVIEPVIYRRPDGHLGAGIQLLHRLGQHVRRVVADQLQGLGIAAGDEHNIGVVFDLGGQIDQLAVELHGQRGAGEARADRFRHRRARHRPVEAAHGFVGQGNGGHGRFGSFHSGNACLWRRGNCYASPITSR